MALREAVPTGQITNEDFGGALLYKYAVNLREQDIIVGALNIARENLYQIGGHEQGELAPIDLSLIPSLPVELGEAYFAVVQKGNERLASKVTGTLLGTLGAERDKRDAEIQNQTMPNGTPLATSRANVIIRDIQGGGVIREASGGKAPNLVQGNLEGIELTDKFTGGNLYLRGKNKSLRHPKGRHYAINGLISRPDYTPNVDIEFR